MEDEPYPEAKRTRIAHFKMETVDAAQIKHTALTLVDAGFEVGTEWHDDGCWLTVYWRDRVAENAPPIPEGLTVGEAVEALINEFRDHGGFETHGAVARAVRDAATEHVEGE